MEFLFCFFSSNPCIQCAISYLNDITKKAAIRNFLIAAFIFIPPDYLAFLFSL